MAFSLHLQHKKNIDVSEIRSLTRRPCQAEGVGVYQHLNSITYNPSTASNHALVVFTQDWRMSRLASDANN